MNTKTKCEACAHPQAKLDYLGGVHQAGLYGNGSCGSPWHVHLDEIQEHRQIRAALKNLVEHNDEGQLSLQDWEQAREALGDKTPTLIEALTEAWECGANHGRPDIKTLNRWFRALEAAN